MKVSFTELAWSDYLWLQKKDKRLLKRVNLEKRRQQATGNRQQATGGGFSPLVGDEILIISCRFHYER